MREQITGGERSATAQTGYVSRETGEPCRTGAERNLDARLQQRLIRRAERRFDSGLGSRGGSIAGRGDADPGDPGARRSGCWRQRRQVECDNAKGEEVGVNRDSPDATGEAVSPIVITASRLVGMVISAPATDPVRQPPSSLPADRGARRGSGRWSQYGPRPRQCQKPVAPYFLCWIDPPTEQSAEPYRQEKTKPETVRHHHWFPVASASDRQDGAISNVDPSSGGSKWTHLLFSCPFETPLPPTKGSPQASCR